MAPHESPHGRTWKADDTLLAAALDCGNNRSMAEGGLVRTIGMDQPRFPGGPPHHHHHHLSHPAPARSRGHSLSPRAHPDPPAAAGPPDAATLADRPRRRPLPTCRALCVCIYKKTEAQRTRCRKRFFLSVNASPRRRRRWTSTRHTRTNSDDDARAAAAPLIASRTVLPASPFFQPTPRPWHDCTPAWGARKERPLARRSQGGGMYTHTPSRVSVPSCHGTKQRHAGAPQPHTRAEQVARVVKHSLPCPGRPRDAHRWR